MLFSLKSFVAAMLALFIALSMGFASPNWAIITTYVVTQPRAGAVLSKSVYRVVGTGVGGAMSVFLVPPLVNAPDCCRSLSPCGLGSVSFLRRSTERLDPTCSFSPVTAPASSSSRPWLIPKRF